MQSRWEIQWVAAEAPLHWGPLLALFDRLGEVLQPLQVCH